jgi:hypothetical protein
MRMQKHRSMMSFQAAKTRYAIGLTRLFSLSLDDVFRPTHRWVIPRCADGLYASVQGGVAVRHWAPARGSARLRRRSTNACR